jgi:hypothetical protein
MNEPIYLVKQLEEISKINKDLNSAERLDLFKKVLKSLHLELFLKIEQNQKKEKK